MQEALEKHIPLNRLGSAVTLISVPAPPGANVQALFFRVSMLRMFKVMTDSDGSISFWLQGGKPEDVVFKALATMPMTGLPPGGRQGLPFDVENLSVPNWPLPVRSPVFQLRAQSW